MATLALLLNSLLYGLLFLIGAGGAFALGMALGEASHRKREETPRPDPGKGEATARGVKAP